MKKMLPLAFVAALALFSSCAHKYYTSSVFEQQSAGHRTIAILPAQMVFTGAQPKNLKPEDIAKLEETESRTFQQALFDGILRHAETRDYTSSVQVQDVSTTLKLLQDAGISIRDSWTANDADLAKALGVDAVVRMRIQKKRYMSDLASLGIGVGNQVLWQITSRNNNVIPPYVPNKTNDIFASCSIVSNNATLWNDTYERSSDYARPAEEVIADITGKFGKHFPYRKRRGSVKQVQPGNAATAAVR